MIRPSHFSNILLPSTIYAKVQELLDPTAESLRPIKSA